MSFCKLEAIQSLFYPSKMKHLVQTLVVSRFETLTFVLQVGSVVSLNAGLDATRGNLRQALPPTLR